jgi:hypothetical protein
MELGREKIQKEKGSQSRLQCMPRSDSIWATHPSKGELQNQVQELKACSGYPLLCEECAPKLSG